MSNTNRRQIFARLRTLKISEGTPLGTLAPDFEIQEVMTMKKISSAFEFGFVWHFPSDDNSFYSKKHAFYRVCVEIIMRTEQSIIKSQDIFFNLSSSWDSFHTFPGAVITKGTSERKGLSKMLFQIRKLFIHSRKEPKAIPKRRENALFTPMTHSASKDNLVRPSFLFSQRFERSNGKPREWFDAVDRWDLAHVPLDTCGISDLRRSEGQIRPLLVFLRLLC